MTNNDTLRRLRYALNRNDLAIAEITSKSGRKTTEAEVAAWLKLEDEPGFAVLPDQDLCSFLDGLIIEKRGPHPSGNVPEPVEYLSNNEILKKLRIAYSFKSDDMLAVFTKVDFDVSNAELGSFFRSAGHPKFAKCPEQVLRKFIKGLSL
ncbi:YehS family protein [Tichowtungia aerotolerans]|uniref:DUF1456 family protein n=1 Tax=Tichowtungia aerotolerans TaxID=2697043 RepID=A0A6P1M8D6_9BACT|nr:DUF1456 family protein [Tichowtungia aerotolerans]QHI70302.1 DUF1456 family protein [Tichowtungia aerotolerans]